jgi:hypothetical protein
MTDMLLIWPWITLGAWCFGFCAGVAWAAQYRPTVINIRTVMEHHYDD